MPSFISKPCQDLISSMLVKNPIKRPSIFEVLRNPLIYSKIMFFTDDMLLGIEISE